MILIENDVHANWQSYVMFDPVKELVVTYHKEKSWKEAILTLYSADHFMQIVDGINLPSEAGIKFIKSDVLKSAKIKIGQLLSLKKIAQSSPEALYV